MPLKISRFVAFIALVALFSPIIFASELRAYAASSERWNLASNGKKVLSVSKKGILKVRPEQGGKFSNVPGVNGERFSSVAWDGRYFVATGFFSLAFSRDGDSWHQMDLPTGTYFDPGNIISDAEFFNSSSMSLGEIEAFIDSKVNVCRAGYVCLEDFEEQTWSRDATVLCNRYSSSGQESAAEIIFKVSKACGVSPQVLLVLLQKEQGLVTHTWPSSWRFDKATGYACPDTAPCDTQYYGFYNQVYNAAKQFKRYGNPPGTSKFFTWYPVGAAGSVLYHPNSSCGRRGFTIKNQATAGLYYYTPYTPNAESLAAYSGLGNSCSSYGNRNFWRYFNLWFADSGDYRNWAFTRNGVGYVVDQDGTTLSIDLDAKRWSFANDVPNSKDGRLVAAGVNEAGKTVVERDDGRHFSLNSSGKWRRVAVSTITPPGPKRFTASPRPVIIGTAAVGETISASVEGWNPTPDSFQFRWFADGKLINDQNGASITLSKNVVGKAISVRVTASREQTLTVNRTSTRSAAVSLPRISAPTRPTISGDSIEGGTLSVSVEGWHPAPDNFKYRWFADGKMIVGETNSWLVLTKDLVGARVSVRVRAVKSDHESVAKSSVESKAVRSSE